MDKKKKKIIRVVLDTNILVSALLFRGELSQIHRLWKKRLIIPLFTKETFQEFHRVLSYPKFTLTINEIQVILEEEILPYFDIIEHTADVQGVCRDPDDDMFISCAVSGRADFIVSGDRDLLDLKRYHSIKIINPSEFITTVSGSL